ncbi:MAG: OpgC domain-containing protein [Hyphomicrobium sp.]|nr:OpgC domain-containing protein [Hyphomicrobium sp.]
MKRPRDVRLDFFRGLGMFIIFIAHIPQNPWNDWIPARFGFSDATEIFVFCSGMASAIAFGTVFEQRGFLMGLARILHRCWQVYWTHIGLFISAVAMMAGFDKLLGTGSTFVHSVNFGHFLEKETASGFFGLLTLTYVPNLFDILPMYLVMLAMIPVMMALSRVGHWAPIAFSVALWLVGTAGYLQFPAEPWSNRPWFFHPLAWQLVFFAGFAFIRGWIPSPPIDRRLVTLCSAVLIVSALLTTSLGSMIGIPHAWAFLPPALMEKGTFGALRFVHFLSLAYLAYAAAGPRGERLKGPIVNVCRKVGQQALAVFAGGILLSLASSVVLHETGRGALPLLAVHLVSFACLVAIAYVVAWFKSTPWKTHARRIPTQLDNRSFPSTN